MQKTVLDTKKIPPESREICKSCIHYQENAWSINDSTNQILEEQKTESKNGDNENYLGLCGICEHKRICSLAGTEGGIWHCRDFE